MFKNLAVFLLLLATTVFPAGLIVYGVRAAIDEQDRKSWPTTDGTVLESELVERTNRSVILRVRYRYEIGGTAHEGTDEIGRPIAEPAAPSELRAGEPIAVHYDASSPQRSALEVGDFGSTIFFIAFGTIGTFVLAPLVVYFGSLAFAEAMMVKGRYHLRKGKQALREAVAGANQIYEAEGEMPDVLAERGEEVISQAAEVEALMREVEQGLRGGAAESANEPLHEAGGIGRPVEHPLPVLGYGWFWKTLLAGLVIYAAIWGFAHWLESPRLTLGLMFIAAAMALVGPVAIGIWIGQRMVERGRRLQADALGWSLVVGGALVFAWFASRSKEGHWEMVDYGHLIGPAGTFAGLGMLLLGLGTALRHRRRRRAW